MTVEHLRELHDMTTAHVRRNHHLCEAQLKAIRLQGNPKRLDDAAADLASWRDACLDELVRRGERI